MLLHRSTLALLGTLVLMLQGAAASVTDYLQLHTRRRELLPDSTNIWRAVSGTNLWDATRTAIVVCDMWDRHWCPDATERVGELAPRMNAVLAAARQRGVLIIHCPSETMGFYKEHPARRLAQSAPRIETKIPLQGWCNLQGQKEPSLPIDDSDGGCDGCPDCPSFGAWKRQHPALEIQEGDALTDSAEAFYFMRARGVTNVIVMGVHENMCVLGRPFSIRQLVAQGQNVVLMRDMTDSMYNHRRRPYVSHFVGTDLVCEHIEKYWCPSITSVDFVGGEPFRFQEDRRKRLVIVTGENEYATADSLAEFASRELEWRGIQVSWVQSSSREGDPDFNHIEAIDDADAILLSVRRRTPPAAMMQALRRHFESGRGWIGIRTASHAFDAKPADGAHVAWPTFDDDVLGADYLGHYGNKPGSGQDTVVRTVTGSARHPILNDVDAGGFRLTSTLYKYQHIAPTVTVLCDAVVDGSGERQPLAWVNEAQGRRVFYTSAGSTNDFQSKPVRRLLLNGILWALGEPVPPEEREPVPTPKAAAPSPAPSTPQPPAPASNPLERQQEAPAPALSPSESRARFQVADDLEWEQVLAEPLIAQPVFLNFDERGRMWVVEYRQYPHPAGLKMLSRDSVWRSVYDKVPPPPPHHFKGADRISIHEDTDGNGSYDKHTVFVDGLNITTAVERGRGGVWVLNPPYLLFYPDANGDDIPDGDPEVRLSGFGLEDTHSVVNSLRWGPDGWLYAAQGSTVTGNVFVHGADGKPLNPKPIYSQGQNIWRYHPENRIYEVFSEGGGNAFGCELDSKGRIFSGHNGGDTRGFHYFQGAYLQKGFEKHGPLSNPFAYGFFPPMPHHSTPRFTHTFLVYEGGALPARCNGHLFGLEPLQGRIVEAEMAGEGSTFHTRDVGRPVVSDDRWFRPVDIKLGPDGAIYVCDWYDQQVNHFRNHEGRMDASNGRVYRLKAKGSTASRPLAMGALSTRQLIGQLEAPNRWVRQTALRLLADRLDGTGVAALRDGLKDQRGQLALEWLWAIRACGGWNESLGMEALGHEDPFVRAWAVRFLGDGRNVSTQVASRLSELAASDPDLGVRGQLAATAQRLPVLEALAILRGLASRSEDVDDNRMPLLIWWALESKCESSSVEVLGWLKDAELWKQPVVRRHLLERLARRFAQTGTQRDLLVCARLFELSPDPEATSLLMAGFEAAFRGRPMSGLPAELLQAFNKHRGMPLSLQVRQGDAAAVDRALRLVLDEAAPRKERLELLGALGEVRQDRVVPTLLKVLRGASDDDGLRQATLVALQPFDRPEIAEAVVGLYPRLGSESLPVAQTLLASRAGAARRFTQAIAEGWGGWSAKPFIAAERVPLSMVRKIKLFRDPELRALAEKVWPDVGSPTTAEMEAHIARTAAVVRGGTGDPYAGRTLFQNTCAQCHRLFGSGAEVGPDLTVYKRDDLETMLLSIINPSAEIREGYEGYAIEMQDGRSLSGFLVEQTPRSVVLRGTDGQNTVVDRREMASMEPSRLSLMPEGLLDSMNEQQTRDVFAYLRSTQPLVGEPPKP